MQPLSIALPITPRRELDFGVPGDVPRFWFGGDPFRTRLFDVHSLITPSAEKFFINSVREYRNEIADPELAEDVKAFIMQEGQHSLQHARFNRRLKAQGIEVDEIETRLQVRAETWRIRLPRAFALAMTAAFEHFTAVIGHAIIDDCRHFADADPRMFALYAWHSAEELEHRAVCFDVMQKTARVGYWTRIVAIVFGTPLFLWQITRMTNRLLRADGFSVWQRLALWLHGLKWMYGGDGLFRVGLGHYFAYFRPGFHPSQHGETRGYSRWVDTLQRTGDPMIATTALRSI